MTGDEAFELLSFDRPDGLTVNQDWQVEGPLSYPETFLPNELSTDAAAELLALLSGCPVSPGLNAWLGSVRGDLVNCEAQVPLGSES